MQETQMRRTKVIVPAVPLGCRGHVALARLKPGPNRPYIFWADCFQGGAQARGRWELKRLVPAAVMEPENG